MTSILSALQGAAPATGRTRHAGKPAAAQPAEEFALALDGARLALAAQPQRTELAPNAMAPHAGRRDAGAEDRDAQPPAGVDGPTALLAPAPLTVPTSAPRQVPASALATEGAAAAAPPAATLPAAAPRRTPLPAVTAGATPRVARERQPEQPPVATAADTTRPLAAMVPAIPVPAGGADGVQPAPPQRSTPEAILQQVQHHSRGQAVPTPEAAHAALPAAPPAAADTASPQAVAAASATTVASADAATATAPATVPARPEPREPAGPRAPAAARTHEGDVRPQPQPVARAAESAIAPAAEPTPREGRAPAEQPDAEPGAPAPVSLAMPAYRPPPPAVEPARAHVAPRVGSSDWAPAMAHQLLRLGAQGERELELHLHPADLGPLKVTLSISDQQAQVLFVSDQPAVRQALEAALPQLRASFADQGISLGQTAVGSGSGQPAADHATPEHGQRRHPDPGTAGTPATPVQREPARRPAHGGTALDTFA